MSMCDEEEEDEKVFHLVSNISKDNITARSSFPPALLSVFSMFTVHEKHFLIYIFKVCLICFLILKVKSSRCTCYLCSLQN